MIPKILMGSIPKKDNNYSRVLSIKGWILLITIFSIVAFFIFKSITRTPISYYNLKFSGTITKITNHYRGRYDIELKSKGNEKIILSDYGFASYETKINLGDSLIKLDNIQIAFIINVKKIL